MPTNTAAWIRTGGAPLETGPAPYTPAAADQIVVRNHAIAINPLEWIIQVAGSLGRGPARPAQRARLAPCRP